MMDIRRAAALLLALVMIAALTVGCGKKQSDTPTDTPAAGADVRTPAQQPAKLVCYNGSVTLRFVREEDTWYWGDDRDFPLEQSIVTELLATVQGYAALWVPGTDHAGIATQIKVEEMLRKEEGLTRYDLGREEFLKRVWAWKKQYGNRIVEQQKSLGVSCDWDRSRFTMDEGCSKAVRETFCELYEKGLIYKGNRIINWCPHCRTALSDAEVEYKDMPGAFWYIRYPLKDSDDYLTIATTRPETMLGDTGIAVNPADERYQHLVGKTAILPLGGRGGNIASHISPPAGRRPRSRRRPAAPPWR